MAHSHPAAPHRYIGAIFHAVCQHDKATDVTMDSEIGCIGQILVWAERQTPQTADVCSNFWLIGRNDVGSLFQTLTLINEEKKNFDDPGMTCLLPYSNVQSKEERADSLKDIIKIAFDW